MSTAPPRANPMGKAMSNPPLDSRQADATERRQRYIVAVENMPMNFTEQQLKLLFNRCGTVINAQILPYRTSNLGVVDFENALGQDTAISRFHRVLISVTATPGESDPIGVWYPLFLSKVQEGQAIISSIENALGIICFNSPRSNFIPPSQIIVSPGPSTSICIWPPEPGAEPARSIVGVV